MDILSDIDKRLLEEIQKDIPLTSYPFNEIGKRCNLSEDEVIEKIHYYQKEQIIKDISAIVDGKKLGYKNTLIAVQTRDEFIEETANRINSHPGVSHNYLREHKYNIWFTLSIKKENNFKDKIEKILNGLDITSYLILPAVRIFKLEVNFKFLKQNYQQNYHHISPRARLKEIKLSVFEKKLIQKLQNKLNIISRPWEEVASSLNVSESELFRTINYLKDKGVIKKISGAVRHRNAGFTANAMVCFNIPENDIITAGNALTKFPEVTHCYQRQTYPDWKYSLFAMIHAQAKPECENIINTISSEINCDDYIKLYSTKEFKKERMKYNIT